MTQEHALMNQIRIECGKRQYMVIRMNVFKGDMLMKNGDVRHIQSGIPDGFPDLMVLKNNGEVCFIETKIKPRKPTERQFLMINLLKKHGFKAGVAYSLDEALKILDN